MTAALKGALDERRLRMKDLCEQTGLSRQAIHFYIQQGLLREGTKTGRNMAWYGPEHVERVRLIRQLQEERLLPLKAIRAVLDGQLGDALPAPQRSLLLEVQSRLPPNLGGRAEPPVLIDVDELAARNGVTTDEVDRLHELGLIAVREVAGRRVIPSDMRWLFEIFGQLRSLGFSRELGFVVDDLALYEEAVASLFKRETDLVLGRMAHLSPDRVAPMVEQILPLIHSLFIQLHVAAVRNFFGALATQRTEAP